MLLEMRKKRTQSESIPFNSNIFLQPLQNLGHNIKHLHMSHTDGKHREDWSQRGQPSPCIESSLTSCQNLDTSIDQRPYVTLTFKNSETLRALLVTDTKSFTRYLVSQIFHWGKRQTNRRRMQIRCLHTEHENYVIADGRSTNIEYKYIINCSINNNRTKAIFHVLPYLVSEAIIGVLEMQKWGLTSSNIFNEISMTQEDTTTVLINQF